MLGLFMFRLRAAGKRATGKIRVKWRQIMAEICANQGKINAKPGQLTVNLCK